jgi:hypothetical protein
MRTSRTTQYTPANRTDVKPELWPLPTWVHPEVKYWYDDWRKIRDTIEGEKEVKAESSRYLPVLEGMSAADYEEYISLATYFNFTGKTLGGLSGTLFRRDYTLEGVPERIQPQLKRITKRNQPFSHLVTTSGEELIAMNRCGLLVDLPPIPTTTPEPYITLYTAEHIVDWEESEINGRIETTMVVLRETVTGRDKGEHGYARRRHRPRYRVLRLAPAEGVSATPIYYQEIYETTSPVTSPVSSNFTDVDMSKAPSQTIYPMVRGEYLTKIPFVMFSTQGNVLSVQKPGLMDIAELNISHFRSYAALEQGRFYTGNPIYWAEASGDEGVEYTIGPKKIWLVPPGTRPGLIEFNGHGLRSLEQALVQKESQAAAIGGRIIGIMAQAVAETDNQSEMKSRNELSLLLKVAVALDVCMNEVLAIFLDFANATKDEIAQLKFETNKDFLLEGIGSREFRAILAMYKEGALPVEVLYSFMRKADVIPQYMTQENFIDLLNSADSFPNQADIRARMEGYGSAISKTTESLTERELDIEERKVEVQETKEEREAKAARRQAARPAVPPGTPPAPVVPNPGRIGGQ